MPAHGAGSSCGKNLSTELTSTIGEQRRTNPSVQPMSEDDFVELITHGQPAAPAYFSSDAAMNKRVHPLLKQDRKISQMTPQQVRAALQAGIRVVDARSVEDFAAGHLRGSVNVGFDARLRRNRRRGRRSRRSDRLDHLPGRGAGSRPAAGPHRLRQRDRLPQHRPRRHVPGRTARPGAHRAQDHGGRAGPPCWPRTR